MLDERSVELWTSSEQGTDRLSMRMELSGPEGLRIHRADSAQEGATGHPIVDRCIFISPEHTGALIEVIRCERDTNTLLALIHGNPGSSIRSDQLEIIFSSWPEDAEDWVKRAIELAEAIEQSLANRTNAGARFRDLPRVHLN